RGGHRGRGPGLLGRAGTALDARLPAGVLPRQPAVPALSLSPAAPRLLRLALTLLLPAGAADLLGDPALLPVLPPAPDLLGSRGALRAPPALSARAPADQLGADAALAA